MARSLYAWAAGSNVALASLNNIEAEIQAHSSAWPSLQSLTRFIFSPPIQEYPNRVKTMDKRLTSEGDINHYIEMTETEAAFEYQLTTYLSSGAALDAPITIYLRRKGHTSTDAWKRYNATLVYPDNEDESGDLIYHGNGVVFVRWRLNDLVPLTEP